MTTMDMLHTMTPTELQTLITGMRKRIRRGDGGMLKPILTLALMELRKR